MSELDPARWKKIERILDRALELEPEARTAYLDESCAEDAGLRAEIESLLAADARAGGVLSAPSGLFIARLVERMQAEPDPETHRQDVMSHLLQGWSADQATATVVDESRATCPSCGREIRSPGATCPQCTKTLVDGEASAATSGPRRIAGYRIERELGAGGMGTVYQAHDPKMNRKVALKLMARHHGSSEQLEKRFAQEAWIAGKLSHPNIVKVYERGEEDDLQYFSMELVDGGSLHDVIDRMKRHGRDERLGLEFGAREYIHWAIEQVIAAAGALEHAHRQGIVHRDVKPMNLLLSSDPATLKVADFGLAFEQDATRMTTDGKVLGTLMYMAPEQLLGKQKEVDARSDIYALGVTLYELLTLQAPYKAEGQMYASAVLSGEARRPSRLNTRIGRDLEIVICKALEKLPADRYASARAFADDLDNVLNLRPIRARPTGRLRRIQKWVRRKPMHATVAAILVLGLPVLGMYVHRDLQNRRVARIAQVETLVKQVRWLAGRNQHREVNDRADRVLKLDPDNVFAISYRALGRLRLALPSGDGPSARKLKNGALSDSARLVEIAPEASWSHRLRATVLRELGRIDESDHERRLAEGLRTETPSDVELEYDALLAKDAKDYARAIELYDQLVRQRPGDAIAFGNRAAAFDFLEDFDKAYLDYKVAVGLDPGLELPRIDLTRICVGSERFDEAREHLDRAFEIAPDSKFAHAAEAYYSLYYARQEAYVDGDPDSAIDTLGRGIAAARRGIELDPTMPWGYVNLGLLMTDRARLADPIDRELLDQAFQSYELALSRWDGPPQDKDEYAAYAAAVNNTCDVSIELHLLDQAVETCTRATRLLPGNPVPHYNLAGVHALAGRNEDALSALRKDLALGDIEWQYLSADRWFEGLRDDPRFSEILERMKAKAEKKNTP